MICGTSVGSKVCVWCAPNACFASPLREEKIQHVPQICLKYEAPLREEKNTTCEMLMCQQNPSKPIRTSNFLTYFENN